MSDTMAGAPWARLRIALLVVLLAGFALRIWRLDYQELRGDEAFGFFFTQQPYTQIVSQTLALAEPHPVASYVIQRAWLKVAGTSEFALRFTSAWFSVLAVALLFRLARATHVPAFIAVISAGLLAFSPYAVWHGQDARMYGMSLALTLASSVLAMVWLERRSPAGAVSYVAISVLALHTHYFAVFILLAQNLYVGLLAVASLWGAGEGRATTRVAVTGTAIGGVAGWALMQAGVALLYAPWIAATRHVLLGYHGNADSPRLFDATFRALAVFAGGEATAPEHKTLVASVGLFLAAVGLVSLSVPPNTRKAALWNALYLGVPIVATWVGAQSRPIFDERYLAAAAPPYYVLAASSLLALRWRCRQEGWRSQWGVWALRAAVGLSVAVFVLAMGFSLVRYYTDPAYSKTRGWRHLATRLDQLSACVPAAEVRLVQNYPDPTLWYYYDGPVEHLVMPPVAHGSVEARALAGTLADQGVRRLVFVEQAAANWDEDGIARQAIEERFTLAAETASAAWKVALYEIPPFALERRATTRVAPTALPLHARFDNGIALERVSVEPHAVVEGGAIVVNAEWSVSGRVKTSAGVGGDGRDLNVFVQLLNGQGQLVAQQDRVFPTGPTEHTLQDAYGILVPETLDAGAYTLIAGLYYSDESGADRVLTVTGADHVTLMSVEIVPAGGCTKSAVKPD